MSTHTVEDAAREAYLAADESDDRPDPADLVEDWEPAPKLRPAGLGYAPPIYRSDLAETIAFLRDIPVQQARAMLEREAS